MEVTPININNTRFLANNTFPTTEKEEYSFGKKAVVATTTALSIGTCLAIMAKKKKYSLSPTKMLKNIKNSYILKTKYKAPEIISIGASTCVGGLLGGFMIDKSRENQKAKLREALMQFGNISIPILGVDLIADNLCKKAGKFTKAATSLGGFFVGVYIANFIMNKVCNLIFNNKTNARGVKATDFTAHVDDLLAVANYVSDSNIIQKIGCIIPLALMVAGNEVGNKQAKTVDINA